MSTTPTTSEPAPSCPLCAATASAACVWHASPSCHCVIRCGACGHRFRLAPAPDWLDATVYDAGYHEHRKTAGRPGFGAGARLRHVEMPNVVLGLADRIGYGRNLVVLAERPAS